MKHGLLVIISSPSGGGKNSVINALMADFSGSVRLVTTTTRPMRPGEQDRVDYYFISDAVFHAKLAAGDFVEHNKYDSYWYGTDRKRLQQLLSEYRLVFSQIEVNGKHALDRAGIKNVSIFLLPENFAVLRERIIKRGGLSEDRIAERLQTAKQEIVASADYDHRIVNVEGKFAETVGEIRRILTEATRS